MHVDNQRAQLMTSVNIRDVFTNLPVCKWTFCVFPAALVGSIIGIVIELVKK